MSRHADRPSTSPRTAPDIARRPSRAQWVREWAKALGVALVLWLLLRVLLVEGVYIPSGSMENTLLIGDFLFINKALYGAEVPVVHKRLPAIREPRRLDIVMFESPIEPGLRVVKRIVGVPGDTIAMVGGTVWISGAELEEEYTTSNPATDLEDRRLREWQLPYVVGRDLEAYRPTLKNWGPLVIPADSFFVMGDNRDQSLDSRYWGFLGRDRIEGRPLFIYYSYDRHGVLPLPFITSIRWGRILSTPD